MKVFYEMMNIGKAKYVINFHDGVKRREDGSAFFDIRIFNNRLKAYRFVRELIRRGYTDRRLIQVFA